MKSRNERGFTLVELLVVIAIIGILAAIAIPMFSQYRTQAFNTRAANDLRTLIAGQEAYYVDHENYLTCGSPEMGGVDCVGSLPGVTTLSEGMLYIMVGGQAEIVPVMQPEEEEDSDAFIGVVCHVKGNQLYAFQSLAAEGLAAGVVQREAIDCENGISALMGLIGGGGGGDTGDTGGGDLV